MAVVVKSQMSCLRPPNHRTHNLTPVTIFVGDEKTPFTLYKEVLSYYSPYFRNAFEGSFREADDRTISLADVSVPTFRHVARWLHMEGMEHLDIATLRAEVEGTCPESLDSSDTVKAKEDGKCVDRPLIFTASTALTDLYIFADAYDIRLLRNHIMDVWREEEINIQGVGMASDRFLKAIKSLPATSSLYRYLLKRYAAGFTWHKEANEQWLGEIISQLPQEFTYKFIVEQSRAKHHSKRPLYKDFYGWCKYHEHDQLEEKQICQELVAKLREDFDQPATVA